MGGRSAYVSHRCRGKVNFLYGLSGQLALTGDRLISGIGMQLS